MRRRRGEGRRGGSGAPAGMRAGALLALLAGNLGQPRMRQRADGVKTEITPELDPDIITNIIPDPGDKPGFLHRRTESVGSIRGLPIRLSHRVTLAFDMPNDAWFGNLGRRINNETNGALRPDDIPEPAIRVDTVQLVVFMRPFELVEIPPGNAINSCDYSSLGCKKTFNLRHYFRDRVGFKGADNVVLWRQAFRSICTMEMVQTFPFSREHP